ncbi:hypothetical protein BACUNI_01952 [Bacteroides uniformis ATCC 8492]|uniref:Uncharacterized protein n=1 Tax=Bacteroides uniformis (strain ATCC 8492 / DSM 6597 / CCUG 4942 / CIP 103695 / JCM 5828 / KCTC 5204 / NCTC 13054 / VPI 0061) TaxID=411479 RepID=A0ABC9ND28_BACUC|nr:hypothetical protein BACUNI_01952 [Bacteroides uniformis ATCC 8492]
MFPFFFAINYFCFLQAKLMIYLYYMLYSIFLLTKN